MRVNFLLLLFFLMMGSVCAQSRTVEVEVIPNGIDTVDAVLDSDYLKTDSILRLDYQTENRLYPKPIKESYRDKYKEKEFNYTTIKPKESLWERIERRLAKFLDSIFGGIDGNGINNWTQFILRILLFAIIAAALYFLIRFLIDRDGNFIFSRKNSKVGLHDTEFKENIHEIDFPQRILAFEKEQDFRSAIRFQFLYVLKKMADKDIIQWNPEKTNKDYLQALSDSKYKNQYQELALIFDYVWYGEFEIDQSTYQGFKNQYEQAKF